MVGPEVPRSIHPAARRSPESFEHDARMALTAGMPLLLMGPTGPALLAMQPWLPQPIITLLGGQPLTMPAPDWTGTVVIHEVDRCAGAEQEQLLHWLGARRRTARIVSTTTASLLPRVETGKFLEELYYRLNMVCIDVTVASVLPSDEPFGVLPVDAVWVAWPPSI